MFNSEQVLRTREEDRGKRSRADLTLLGGVVRCLFGDESLFAQYAVDANTALVSNATSTLGLSYLSTRTRTTPQETLSFLGASSPANKH